MVVPVVFSADGNYGMFVQVAVVSLMENRGQDTAYDVYVLHADDYGQDAQMELKRVFEAYGSGKINFISMGNAYDDAIEGPSVITKAAFYRLSIHKLLPPDYRRCIYCDGDTVINCDLGPLFQTELGENYLAGAVDPVIRYSGKREEFPDLNGYINSGVLVINLEKWRETAIENLFGKYLPRRLKYHDQDILNLACQGKICLLEKDRYVVSGVLNRKKYREVKSAIIHYCGLIKPWDVAVCNPYFKLWLGYAKKASVALEEGKLIERRDRVKDFLRKSRIRDVIVWGIMASTPDICYFLEELGLKVAAIGDKDEEKVRQGCGDFPMMDARGVCGMGKDVYFMVNSVNAYGEIKKMLAGRGISPDRIISWYEFKNIMTGKKEQ